MGRTDLSRGSAPVKLATSRQGKGKQVVVIQGRTERRRVREWGVGEGCSPRTEREGGKEGGEPVENAGKKGQMGRRRRVEHELPSFLYLAVYTLFGFDETF